LDNYYLECIINKNKIIINYPENSNKNKFVTVIGKLEDYDKTFITEYILIFENRDKQKNYINKIKGYLDIILESFEFNNNILIIEENSVQEVIIIKYDPNNSEFVNNQSSSQINTNGFDNWNNININEDHNNYINAQNKIDKGMTNKLNSNFKISPKIGLQNIGATCYMNSTLQCFCHIKKLVEYFKYNSNIIEFVNKDKENKSLTSSFKLLIEKLWPKAIINKYYAPEDFKKKISVLNPLFEGIAANDAKDLVNFIIMKLHEELNQPKNNSDTNNNN
jgi:ubiquitin C-terminal hydrolase